MTGDGVLASVTHVMLDEVHERDRLTDFLLIVLREVISKYRALRIIIMSATLDTERLSTYFNNCPIITGRPCFYLYALM
jgi:HrpA-like RNA helicase